MPAAEAWPWGGMQMEGGSAARALMLASRPPPFPVPAERKGQKAQTERDAATGRRLFRQKPCAGKESFIAHSLYAAAERRARREPSKAGRPAALQLCKESAMKIVSLAPHDIAVCAVSGAVPAGGRDFVLARRSAEPVYRFPSRGCAKGTGGETPCRDVMGIPVRSTACRAPQGVPPHREGVMRIVRASPRRPAGMPGAGPGICSSRPARPAARAAASSAAPPSP